MVACGGEIEGSSDGATMAIGGWVEAGDERTEELWEERKRISSNDTTYLDRIYMSYAVSPVLCLPKNATAEFLIRFIQSAVEIAETENLGKLKRWSGEVGLCSSPRVCSAKRRDGIRYKLCTN